MTMTNTIRHTMTTESITVVYNGKTYTVREGSPNFLNLQTALRSQDWDAVPDYLTVANSITKWSDSKFTITADGAVTFEGESVPRDFGSRIVKMATDGEDPTPLFRFYERLKKNPSKRSVDQLWPFLNKTGIPITKDGCFLAYKGVNSNFMDKHSGTISNKPGTTVKLPRNSVSDDPNEACHFGLHVGAKNYADSFSGGDGKLVICKVDPQNVVCVPYDSHHEKMRTCEYRVIGVDGEELPDTVYDDGETESTEEEKVAEVVKVEKVKSKDKNKPSATIETKTKSAKGNFDDFAKLDTGELMKKSIEELRKYATHGLEIVGASKIPGGKTALVRKIIRVRR
jgi:hypothetical protein